jgi:hypothetical protein
VVLSCRAVEPEARRAARGVEQQAQLAVVVDAHLVRHAEREDGDLGRCQRLELEQRPGAPELLDVGAERAQDGGELRVAAVEPLGAGGHLPLDRRAAEVVEEDAIAAGAARGEQPGEALPVGAGQLRQLDREQRPRERRRRGVEEAQHRHAQPLRQRQVELRHSAGERRRVVAEHAVGGHGAAFS